MVRDWRPSHGFKASRRRTVAKRAALAARAPTCNVPPSDAGGVAEAGYEVSLADFRELLRYGPWRAEIAPLLLAWFGCDVVGDGAGAKVLDGQDRDVDVAALHAAIQADPERQGRLYRAAMTLWR